LLENLCMPQIAGRLLRTLFNKLGVEENEEWIGGAQIFQKSLSHSKILGARMVTWSRFHTEEPQILGATVHPCKKMYGHVSSPEQRGTRWGVILKKK
jgi:hypothetical protein